ncbi:MAG: phosphoglycerate mutase, partial [Methanoregulaceae archaeon]|nr:phosphoglycerate mutase [Methanoregulaceae archaeon]
MSTDRKYIVVLGDGMADEPIPELGGKTPLEYANTPNMDRIARDGMCGMMRTVPAGFEPGSDIANL